MTSMSPKTGMTADMLTLGEGYLRTLSRVCTEGEPARVCEVKAADFQLPDFPGW